MISLICSDFDCSCDGMTLPEASACFLGRPGGLPIADGLCPQLRRLGCTYKTKLDSICELERYRKKNPEAKAIELPFECHYCHAMRMDFEIVDADGCPVCSQCFSDCVDFLERGRSPGSGSS